MNLTEMRKNPDAPGAPVLGAILVRAFSRYAPREKRLVSRGVSQLLSRLE